MTEVHMNGNGNAKFHQEEHVYQELESLEDSISSLLSHSLINDEYKTITGSYKRCAKLFINKKFIESYKIVKSLVDQSIALYNDDVITESDFNNIWSLYFNLIDIFLNKSIVSLSKQDKDELVSKFNNDEYFHVLYNDVNKLVHPKLIVLLMLIKLNNDQTDLSKLRSEIDLYLVNYTFVNEKNSQDEKANPFQELLEIYHVYLLAKLNEFEESEYLIDSNPFIHDKDGMKHKLKQAKIDLKERELQKKRMEEKKAADLQRRKEQQAREEEEYKRFKELEKAKKELIKSQKDQNNRLINKKKQSSTTSPSDQEVSIIDILREKFIKNKLVNTNVLVLIFSILSLLVFAKNYKLILNRKIREYLTRFYVKLANTLKMAFQVTYM